MYEHLTECYDSVMTMLCTSYVNVLMCEGFVRNMWLKFMPDVIVSNVSHESVITLPYVIKNVTYVTLLKCYVNLTYCLLSVIMNCLWRCTIIAW